MRPGQRKTRGNGVKAQFPGRRPRIGGLRPSLAFVKVSAKKPGPEWQYGIRGRRVASLFAGM
jgi:hypothetical protein